MASSAAGPQKHPPPLAEAPVEGDVERVSNEMAVSALMRLFTAEVDCFQSDTSAGDEVRSLAELAEKAIHGFPESDVEDVITGSIVDIFHFLAKEAPRLALNTITKRFKSSLTFSILTGFRFTLTTAPSLKGASFMKAAIQGIVRGTGLGDRIKSFSEEMEVPEALLEFTKMFGCEAVTSLWGVKGAFGDVVSAGGVSRSLLRWSTVFCGNLGLTRLVLSNAEDPVIDDEFRHVFRDAKEGVLQALAEHEAAVGVRPGSKSLLSFVMSSIRREHEAAKREEQAALLVRLLRSVPNLLGLRIAYSEQAVWDLGVMATEFNCAMLLEVFLDQVAMPYLCKSMSKTILIDGRRYEASSTFLYEALKANAAACVKLLVGRGALDAHAYDDAARIELANLMATMASSFYPRVLGVGASGRLVTMSLPVHPASKSIFDTVLPGLKGFVAGKGGRNALLDHLFEPAAGLSQDTKMMVSPADTLTVLKQYHQSDANLRQLYGNEDEILLLGAGEG
jgi:hypothetical protein